MRQIVPIANLQRRLPEAGRIRTGVKSGKAMKSIATVRFTSADEAAIGQVAALYGGSVAPWKDAPTPGQFEVITDANEIRIVLPPDPLGGSPVYEQWSGGGCQRRCDGVTAQIPTQGPDGPELADVACICAAKGEMACSPHTRLSVILPEIRFAGTWRYESATSWNVATEMPGMVELVQQLQSRGLTRALLAIEHRKSVFAGQTRRFTIPVIRVEESMDALAAGAARVGALPSPDRPALAAAEPPALASPDDEVIDAELVENPAPGDVVTDLADRLNALSPDARRDFRHQLGSPADLTAAQVDRADALVRSWETKPPPPPPPPIPDEDAPDGTMTERQSKALHAALRKHDIIGPARHTWAAAQLSREITSMSNVTADEASRLIDHLTTGAPDEVMA